MTEQELKHKKIIDDNLAYPTKITFTSFDVLYYMQQSRLNAFREVKYVLNEWDAHEPLGILDGSITDFNPGPDINVTTKK